MRRPQRTLHALRCALVLALTAACSGDDSTGDGDGNNGNTNNGGTNHGTDNSGPDAPAPPAPPAPPEFTDWDCPEGWLAEPAFEEGSIPGLTPHDICRPPPLPEDCPPGFMPLVGHAECVRQGLACPEDDEWHDEDTIRSRAAEFAGRIWYLSPSGSDEGDGTRDAPFATLEEAMRQSASGHILALGRGQFNESVRVFRPVALVGACSEQTSVVADTPSERGPVINLEPGHPERTITVTDLTVSGPRVGVWLVEPGNVLLRAVTVKRAHTLGVFANGPGARMRLEDTIIEQTQPTHRTFGWGLSAQGGARVEAVRGLINHNHDIGVFAETQGTVVTLEDVAITNTKPPQSDMRGGRGLGVQGASVQVLRGLIDHNHEHGVFAGNEGTLVKLEDVAITNTKPQQSDMTNGRGLSVLDGARVEVVRGHIAHNHAGGVLVTDEGSVVTLQDVSIANTQPRQSDMDHGRGLDVLKRARAQVVRGVIDRNHEVGVYASAEGTVVTLEDVAITNTKPGHSDMRGGRGLNVQGASVQVLRGLIDRNHEAGVYASAEGTVVTLEDVAITNTKPPQSDMRGGRGLNVEDGASAQLVRGHIGYNHDDGVFAEREGTVVTLEDVAITNSGGRGLSVQYGASAKIVRGLIDHNHDLGVFASEQGTMVRLEDVAITNTRPRQSDMSKGRGLSAVRGANAQMVRGLLETNHEVGVFLVGRGTTATLRHIAVTDTRQAPCTSSRIAPVCGGFIGSSIIVWDQASITLEDFLITGSALAGLQIIEAPDIQATRGVIRDNVIGVNVQQTDIDLDEVFDNVQSYDNERDFDSQDLPVPDPAEVLESLQDP